MRARGNTDSRDDDEIKPLVYKVGVLSDPPLSDREVIDQIERTTDLALKILFCLSVIVFILLVTLGYLIERVHSLVTQDLTPLANEILNDVQNIQDALTGLSKLAQAKDIVSHETNVQEQVQQNHGDHGDFAAAAFFENVTMTLNKVLEAATHTDTSLHNGNLRLILD